MGNPADLPIYMMSLQAAKQVKVVFSGEGADEFFAGYPKHLAEAVLGRFAPRGLTTWFGRAILAKSSLLPDSARQIRIAGRALAEPDFETRMVLWFGVFSAAERAKIWTGPVSNRQTDSLPFEASASASALRRILHFDQTSWLPDNLLERMDRMTMAASIEARAPFMDIRLAEFSARLPDHWRIGGLTTKRIIKEAMDHRLPRDILQRRKNGFKMPVASWFRGPLAGQFSELLLSPDAKTCYLIDGPALQSLFSEHLSQRRDHSKKLWAVFALETFLREFF